MGAIDPDQQGDIKKTSVPAILYYEMEMAGRFF